MPEYKCSNVVSGRKRTINTKNKLKGNIIFVGRGKVYETLPKGGQPCSDTISAKIAPIEIVKNALSVMEEWKRSRSLTEQ